MGSTEEYVKVSWSIAFVICGAEKLNYCVTFLLKTKQEIVNFSIEVLINIES